MSAQKTTRKQSPLARIESNLRANGLSFSRVDTDTIAMNIETRLGTADITFLDWEKLSIVKVSIISEISHPKNKFNDILLFIDHCNWDHQIMKFVIEPKSAVLIGILTVNYDSSALASIWNYLRPLCRDFSVLESFVHEIATGTSVQNAVSALIKVPYGTHNV